MFNFNSIPVNKTRTSFEVNIIIDYAITVISRCETTL